jgi:chemotaxis signal transduction protein
VLGLVDCRGRLVPVVDLGARLGLCAPRDELALANGHVLLVRDRLGAVGYAVDEVRELSEGAREPLLPTGDARAGLVSATIRLYDGSLAPLLDPPALLTARARHGLRQALAAVGAGA